MSARTYTADTIARAFGDNYSGPPGLMIAVNAAHSCAEELGVLSMAANQDHVDFEMSLHRMAWRLDLAAEIGHAEVTALLARVAELEALVSAKAEAAE